MNRILISIGNSVTVSEVDDNGQCNASKLNFPGQTLRAAIQKNYGSPNLILVWDTLFGTGYHSVTTGCSAGGHGFTFYLEPIYSEQEVIAVHGENVKKAKDGKPAGKSGLTLAFDRLQAQVENYEYYDPKEVFKIICPKCKHTWELTASDIRICSCESGGVYDAKCRCPQCRFEQDILD